MTDATPTDREGYPLAVGDRVRVDGLAGAYGTGTVVRLTLADGAHFADVQLDGLDSPIPTYTPELVRLPFIVDERNMTVCGEHGTYYVYGKGECSLCVRYANPVIGQAVDALRTFGGRHLGPARARKVLEMWARRDQLTQDDVEQVIEQYRSAR